MHTGVVQESGQFIYPVLQGICGRQFVWDSYHGGDWRAVVQPKFLSAAVHVERQNVSQGADVFLIHRPEQVRSDKAQGISIVENQLFFRFLGFPFSLQEGHRVRQGDLRTFHVAGKEALLKGGG